MAKQIGERRLRDLPLLVLLFLVLGLYFVLNAPTAHVHILMSWLDTVMPFLPVFVIPYLLILPLFCVIIIYAYWTGVRFRALSVTILITWVISYLCYVFFQTHVIRPIISGQGLLNDLVRYVYAHDRPYNEFPSLHVAMATLMALYAYYAKLRYRVVIWIFSSLVIASTVLIKQHYCIDIMGGLVLTLVVGIAIFRSNEAYVD